VRLEINKVKMTMKLIETKHIIQKLSEILPIQTLYVPTPFCRYGNLVLRVYIHRNDIKSTKDLMEKMAQIERCKIKGVDNIKYAQLFKRNIGNFASNSEDAQPSPQKIIMTEGVNYLGIYKLKNIYPEIDYNNIYNDNSYINDVMFGKSFVRTFMQSDIKRILKLNHSHISMYVDGTIFRMQFKDKDKDVYNLMGSSAPRKKLEEGAINEYFTNCDDISSALLAGKLPELGTNYHKLRMSTKMMMGL
jgi:hypothetical protein